MAGSLAQRWAFSFTVYFANFVFSDNRLIPVIQVRSVRPLRRDGVQVQVPALLHRLLLPRLRAPPQEGARLLGREEQVQVHRHLTVHRPRHAQR